MLPQMSSIHIGLQQLWHMTPAFENWRRWMALCRAAREPVATLSSIRPLVDGLRLREVRYRYPNGTRTFTIPDLCIPARRTTAVIGPTGSGKTTLLDLLCGLNEPQAGAITADGEALQADTGWRRRLAYIPQETSILDGTLRDNLSWGAMTASDERMFAALDSAAAGEFARRLPNGLDTWVGERGVRLSGGEKQRVALARALLREPELLILDEATSALDTEHQQIILEALRTLHGRTTVVIVTHRFEEIRHLLDGLVRIEDGVVGPWTAL